MQLYCSKQHGNDGSNCFCIHCGEPLPLAAGQLVNHRYGIIRQLGQGGFGRTYLAEDHQKSHQRCVLKEFAPQVQAPEDLQKARELFDREASVLQSLQHPQIPRFHASLQVKIGRKDFFFLVQDYIDGINYEELLEQRQGEGGVFSEEEVIKLLQEILPVLSYIHSRDVVHRDISPDNLIWRRSDNLPVLIDFGGVKQLPAEKGFWFTQLDVNNTLLGKKGYAPEEQLRQGKVFFNSDLYSLAVTVLVLLTGKEPQKLYDSYEGIWSWGREIKVGRKLESVLKKMLAYKPSDRYEKAEDVLADLSMATIPKTQHPYVTKLKTMVVAPGKKQASTIVSKLHSQTQLINQKITIPVWLRPFAVSVGGTTLVVLIGAGTWAVVNSIVRSVTSISIPTISFPEIPSFPNPLGDRGSENITQILRRHQQLEIPTGFFIPFVDNLFHAEKPELNGRILTAGAEDAGLRGEWAGIAGDLLDQIEKANLSKAARQKLGNYGSENEKIWREQARRGEWGNYTIDQLNRDTNEKFDRLFPGQDRGKLNQQTFGQLWYAIAADQVAQVKIK
ncbi:serine/threonine-protein kinase [Nodularia harveyana UHCC-0300]|uniref:non-specific serine/threonine protein kinase n=1 Tax=Nodularia harveyana UHCC-0300 TaxID=2974287 RepID=A0ABU5U8N4_9CYAN|nr:serine/threonine-protein kinase [Nodularia harveyana]MEA5579884.1 serine/threonine-protein kinase [Nodularia harveyana UHCC-0300]